MCVEKAALGNGRRSLHVHSCTFAVDVLPEGIIPAGAIVRRTDRKDPGRDVSFYQNGGRTKRAAKPHFDRMSREIIVCGSGYRPPCGSARFFIRHQPAMRRCACYGEKNGRFLSLPEYTSDACLSCASHLSVCPLKKVSTSFGVLFSRQIAWGHNRTTPIASPAEAVCPSDPGRRKRFFANRKPPPYQWRSGCCKYCRRLFPLKNRCRPMPCTGLSSPFFLPRYFRSLHR